jgi:hypothetical protein
MKYRNTLVRYKEALRIRELNFHPMAGLREQTEMIESYDVSIASTMHNLAMVRDLSFHDEIS